MKVVLGMYRLCFVGKTVNEPAVTQFFVTVIFELFKNDIITVDLSKVGLRGRRSK